MTASNIGFAIGIFFEKRKITWDSHILLAEAPVV
jgi:hypothetical protein